MSKVATTEEIRSHFPALERRHGGEAVAYFDGPGGTQAPRQVVEAMSDYLYHHNANTHWAYPTSIETDQLLAGARSACADFLNARASEIAFGANMTTLTHHLARTLARRYGAGAEIVVTELDHHANIDPWRSLESDFRISVKMARMRTEDGQLDWSDLQRLVTRQTRLLAIGAASNALGTINNLKRAAELARSVGAHLFVDAVHYAPHDLVDVQQFDCDFLVCSAYKFYGPHIGLLYAREALYEELDFPRLAPAPDYPPEVAETGTQNHEGILGAAAAVDFLASLTTGDNRRERLQKVFSVLHTRGQELLTEVWNALGEIKGVSLYGPPPDAPRTPTLAFTLSGVNAEEVARRLAEKGVFVSHGDFYAATVVDRLGLSEAGGLVRAGCACYTTQGEVNRLVEGVKKIAALQ